MIFLVCFSLNHGLYTDNHQGNFNETSIHHSHLQRSLFRHLLELIPEMPGDEWDHEARVGVFDSGFDHSSTRTSVLRMSAQPPPLAKEEEPFLKDEENRKDRMRRMEERLSAHLP